LAKRRDRQFDHRIRDRANDVAHFVALFAKYLLRLIGDHQFVFGNQDLEHAQSSGLTARSPAIARDRVQTGWGRIPSRRWRFKLHERLKAAPLAAENLFNVAQLT
jgi:hypothetical protein